MKNYLQDPKHWRERAEKIRAKAERIWNHPAEQQRMLRIADEYDWLAERAAEWQRSGELLNQSRRPER
ncbi:hypothetical protein I6F35_39005 [Bradyrhizobium sp. BRP22]|uniref:hypothetical protein n=1 Tax=Bradyrhizobium sp. BRP22 TaxID=2793821 RepID=UPI001CD5F8AE|nr:hypothetical protein [Bradyrhizobium sp. BRP22]MCA1459016.1 hypothetical protein [Bradyrhizobium sp. BRP22]